MSFFISDAIADTVKTAASSPGINIGEIAMLLGFVAIFYFLLWRPQAKRAKDHKNLITNLTQGDEVMTSGGLLGKISKMADDFIVLTIASNVEVTIQKNAIAGVLPKGTLKTI